MNSDDSPNALETEPTPSARSLRALDVLNVFLADVRDGVGPYLSIYLIASHHWTDASVGTAMAVVTAAGVVAQTPAGALVDRFTRRREMIAVASLLIGLASISMTFRPTVGVVYLAQAVIGVAACIVAPAVAAISLGLVGRRALDRRIGRNEAFNHAGNVLAAVGAGLLGFYVARELIFWLVGFFGILGAASAMFIRHDEIDDRLARGADDDKSPEVGHAESDAAPSRSDKWRETLELLSDRQILWFVTSVVLFHFANAYMLPLVGQMLARRLPDGAHGASLYMSACIIAAQVVMIPVGVLAGRCASRFGRRATFLVAFAILPVRGVLYTMTAHPVLLIAIQMLDGLCAGIFGVVSVLMIADLTRGSGRFNLLQGLIGTAVGLGASLSALLTGRLVGARGANAGFYFLSAVALAGLVSFYFMVKDTREGEPAAPADRAAVPR